MKCRICGGTCGSPFELVGTMYGTKGRFYYVICDKCGCLQIRDFPDDMSLYYKKDAYYSLNMGRRKLKNKLLFTELKNQICSHSILGKIVNFFYPVNYGFLKLVDKEDSILDVGCGDGEMLRWLTKLGYSDVTGIDPFAERREDIYSIHNVDLLNYKPDKQFKLIYFMHSFEHLENPHEVAKTLTTIIEDDGFVVVVVPLFSKYYWGRYKENLYTLDPPRHFYIHTKRSLCLLMNQYQFELVDFDTETDPAIPINARNVERNRTEKNLGTSIIKGTMVSLLTRKQRKRLKAEEDGAIATFVFRKRCE